MFNESKTIALTTSMVSFLLLLYMLKLQKPIPFIVDASIDVLVHSICPFICSLSLLHWKTYNYISGREKVLIIGALKPSLEEIEGASKKSDESSRIDNMHDLIYKVFTLDGKKLGLRSLIYAEFETLSVSLIHSRIVTIASPDTKKVWSVSIAEDKLLSHIYSIESIPHSRKCSAILEVGSHSWIFIEKRRVLEEFGRKLQESISSKMNDLREIKNWYEQVSSERRRSSAKQSSRHASLIRDLSPDEKMRLSLREKPEVDGLLPQQLALLKTKSGGSSGGSADSVGSQKGLDLHLSNNNLGVKKSNSMKRADLSILLERAETTVEIPGDASTKVPKRVFKIMNPDNEDDE